MSTLEETVAALQRRVEMLETENAGLLRRPPEQSLIDQPTSRRTLLFGSAGLLGALAGGSLLTHTSVAAAAGVPTVEDRVAILRITPTLMRSRGVYWAEHEWHLGPQFTGESVPVVIATATDDYMHRDVTVQCSCSVRIEGAPGAYVAVIMVRGISSHARSVDVHAVAFAG